MLRAIPKKEAGPPVRYGESSSRQATSERSENSPFFPICHTFRDNMYDFFEKKLRNLW